MSGIRVTISEALAYTLLEMFRDNLEAGCDYGEPTINDCDKFRAYSPRQSKKPI